MIELMVVIALIAGLITILLVAVGPVLFGARTARLTTQLKNMTYGVEQFKTDFGDALPPLITGIGRDGIDGIVTPELVGGRDNPAATIQAYRDARYFSAFTLPAYLMGVGDFNGDLRETYDDRSTPGVERNEDDGKDGPGMKHPGRALAWKSSDDSSVHGAPVFGRDYGPYLDPGSYEGMLERVEVGSDLSPSPGGGLWMYRFVDDWGTPIRYYRNWPVRNAGTGLPETDRIPVELRDPKEALLGLSSPGATDITRERDVLNAPYMIVGAGEEPEVYDSAGVLLAPFGDIVVDNGGSRELMVDTSADGRLEGPSDSRGEDILRQFLESNVRVRP